MKKLLLLIFICLAQNVFPQYKEPIIKSDPEDVVDRTEEISTVDTKPEFPGGLAEFFKFFKQNYRITTDNLNGTIYVTFIIEKDGSLTDIKILRDIGHQTGAEAIRVLRKSPKWTPGIQNDKLVRVLYTMPIIVN